MSFRHSLRPGIYPCFSNDHANKYIIYTRRQDAEEIRSAPIFQALTRAISVDFEYIEKIGAPHETMSSCFRDGIAKAEAVDAGLVFLTPDLVFADGSFETIKRLSDAGHDVVFVPGNSYPETGRSRSVVAGSLPGVRDPVAPRDLMQVALDNLHPLANSSLVERRPRRSRSRNLYWRVGDEGIVGRCFHLHPLFVRPQRKNAKFFGTVDDDFVCAACPDASRDYVVTDSDELLAIELSDPGHFFQTGFRKGSVEDAAIGPSTSPALATAVCSAIPCGCIREYETPIVGRAQKMKPKRSRYRFKTNWSARPGNCSHLAPRPLFVGLFGSAWITVWRRPMRSRMWRSSAAMALVGWPTARGNSGRTPWPLLRC